MSAAELTVDPSDPTPPYEQLRRQLVELIATGRLAGGDRLPPVRQLAGDLGLANGTVARTYRELESSGHLVTSRGAGTRVAKDIRPSPAVELLREHAETYALRAPSWRKGTRETGATTLGSDVDRASCRWTDQHPQGCRLGD